MVVTKVVPLWFGARGVEFQWVNLQEALDSNINLVRVYPHMYSMYIHMYNIITTLWVDEVHCSISSKVVVGDGCLN